MHRIAVISDSHIPERASELPEAFRERIRSADHVLHAGDFTSAGVQKGSIEPTRSDSIDSRGRGVRGRLAGVFTDVAILLDGDGRPISSTMSSIPPRAHQRDSIDPGDRRVARRRLRTGISRRHYTIERPSR